MDKDYCGLENVSWTWIEINCNWTLIFLLMSSFLHQSSSRSLFDQNQMKELGVLMCVDDLKDFKSYNWTALLTNYSYAQTSAELPDPLKNKLNATGIFYIQGGLNTEEWIINRYFKPESTFDTEAIYLYISYYAQANMEHTQMFVYPVKQGNTVGNYFQRLESSNGSFQWQHMIFQLDTYRIQANFEWMGFQALGFNEQEYFLVDKIALVEGPLDQSQEQLINEIREKCPTKLHPITTSTTTISISSSSSTSYETTQDSASSEFVTDARSDPTETSTTLQEVTTQTDSDTSTYQYVWLAVATIVCSGCIVIIILLWRRLVYLRRRQRNLTKEEISEFYVGTIQISPDYFLPISSLTYDPSLEIPKERMQINETQTLGRGQFGRVMKGLLTNSDGTTEDVAIKTVNSNVEVETFKALLSEIKVMSYLGKHENILTLLGACTTSIQDREVYALVEYCGLGDLKTFLKTNELTRLFREPIDTTEKRNLYIQWMDPNVLLLPKLFRFSMEIANGMKYLTEKNVIHGDLAARNILLTDDYTIKISDFGLSRKLLNYTIYHKRSHTALPWSWMSIESLKEMKFSIKSDVWSYGVVLWEIFSLGDDPYKGSHFDSTFIKDLSQGKRLAKPDWAPNIMYTMMLECWKEDPFNRPSFDSIYSQLNKMLADQVATQCDKSVNFIVTAEYVLAI